MFQNTYESLLNIDDLLIVYEKWNGGSLRGAMADVLESDIEVREYELQQQH